MDEERQTPREETPEQDRIPGPRNAKERFYEKLPFTYRQVDFFVKALLVVILVVLIAGIVKGR